VGLETEGEDAEQHRSHEILTCQLHRSLAGDSASRAALALAISAYGLVPHGRSRRHVHSGSDPTQRSEFELRGPAMGAVGDPRGWSALGSIALGATAGV